MVRINWNRNGKVRTPWYEDPTHAIAPVRDQRRKPKAIQADPDEAFLALLAIGVDDRQQPSTMRQSLQADEIWQMSESVKAARESLRAATQAIVHCDGCCHPNPGPGGWGLLIDVATGRRVELCGGKRQTTNNGMEMTAAIVALSVLPPECAITIISDSQYLIKGASIWMAGWKRNGFLRGGAPIPNADLWREMDALTDGRPLTWKWVRGHNGHAGNERADALASRGIRRV